MSVSGPFLGVSLAFLFLLAWGWWAVWYRPDGKGLLGLPTWTYYTLLAVWAEVVGPKYGIEVDLCWRGDDYGAVWWRFPPSDWRVVSQWWVEHPFDGHEELTFDQWREVVSFEADVIGYGDQGVFIAFERIGGAS